MIELGLSQVYATVEAALQSGDIQKASNLLFPALDQFPHDAQLWFYAGHIMSKRESYAMARIAAERSAQLLPSAPAYANIGAICRRLNDTQGAVEALQKSIEYQPDDANTWNNVAANYINEGDPLPGIAAAQRALSIKPDMLKAKWNLGLLQLEVGDFANGWRNYREGLYDLNRQLRSYTPNGEGEPLLVESLNQLGQWQEANGKKPRVIVWGEQGIGDEIMFASIMEDFSQWAEIVFECHPRLESIFRRSFPFVAEIHPTRKDDHISWYAEAEPCQFKLPIGDLGLLLRPTLESFRSGARPYLVADPAKVDWYRRTLKQIVPDGKFVGVAWTGGVIRTARTYRCCQLEQLYDLGKGGTLVSLQYEDDTLAVQHYMERTGRTMLRFPAITRHYDYDHTLALVCALDSVVTVCQSVAHLAAAAGVHVSVLVPDKPAWRYGLSGEQWFWYGARAQLFRRSGAKWDEAIQRMLLQQYGITPLPDHEKRLIDPVPKWGRMLELGAKQFGRYKEFFLSSGFDEHVSVDLNGKGGSLALDLQKPLGLGQFDVVTNFGTTEHVDEQEPAWKNVHDAVRVGGYLVSTTPLPGDWPDHGRWYPSDVWYRRFCQLNGYEMETLITECEKPRRMVCLRARKVRDLPFRMPDLPMYENQSEKRKTGAYV